MTGRSEASGEDWETAIQTSENGAPTTLGWHSKGWFRIEQSDRQVGLTPSTARQMAVLIDVNDESPLEQRAFDDLDEIAEVAEAALAALGSGDIEAVDDSLREIRDTAGAWE